MEQICYIYVHMWHRAGQHSKPISTKCSVSVCAHVASKRSSGDVICSTRIPTTIPLQLTFTQAAIQIQGGVGREQREEGRERVCVCVCVCVSERERWREREGEREREWMGAVMCDMNLNRNLHESITSVVFTPLTRNELKVCLGVNIFYECSMYWIGLVDENGTMLPQ